MFGLKGARRVLPHDPNPHPILVRLSDVEPTEVTWLWEPYIPIGKTTLFEGDPGLGKTFIALDIAAAVTKGQPFPFAKNNVMTVPGNVLYMTAEDGLADTLRPRLDAVGADSKRVMALEGWQATDESGKMTSGAITLKDILLLEEAIQNVRPKLVIIDPLQAYLGAGVDMHRANEVRPVMSALGKLAEKYDFAALCIRHLSKSASPKAIYSGLGSIDFAAAARSVIRVGEHEGERLLVHVKSSLAPQGKSLRYALLEGGLTWLGPSDVTADDMQSPPSFPERGTQDDAKDFLLNILSPGPVPASHVERAAKAEGISGSTLRRAKESLRIRSRREGTSGGERGRGTWVWEIDDESIHSSKDIGEHLKDLE